MSDTDDLLTGAKVRVGECELGRGVFAAEFIRTGDPILTLSGDIITNEVTRTRGPQEANALQIGPDVYIDVVSPGVFLNHSCHPNAGIVMSRVLIALVDIRVGDQIFFDYSTTIGSEDGWTMICRCGTDTCRGIVGDFRSLSPELRERYSRLGIVQGFLLENASTGTTHRSSWPLAPPPSSRR